MVAQVWAPTDFPRDTGSFEVAFAGRSNVGKSTLLNKIAGQNGLAFVSRKPGKTKAIFYYLIAPGRYLVDLPGYGYAAVERELAGGWQLLAHQILQRKSLRTMVWLFDARHGPVQADLDMRVWLGNTGYQCSILPVLTKGDQVGAKKAEQMAQDIHQWLGDDGFEKPLVVSALKGDGIRILAGKIKKILKIR